MVDRERLRPEVQKALDDLSYFLTGTHNHDDFYTIRAELLRLAAENAAARDALETLDVEGHKRAEKAEAELAEARKNETVALGLWNAAEGRATKAEAELAEAQNTIAAQQGTMGALKRKLALSEGELAALKARIAEAPVGVFGLCYNGHEPGFLGFPQAIDNLPRESMLGKRMRLVVEE